MGALVAFEVTRELRRRDAPLPQHLILSAHRAPQLRDPEPPIYQLPDDRFIEALRSLNGITQEVLDNAELMELVMPVLRSDFELCETYQYRAEAPLDLPLVILGGAEDAGTGFKDLLGWREQSTCPYMLQMFRGDHFYLQQSQEELLQLVRTIALGVGAVEGI